MVNPAPDHLDHVGPLATVELMALRDAVPRLQAAPAAGCGGVLGHEDRVVAVRGLPAVVARLGGREPLRNDLCGVSTHGLRTAQLSRGPLAPPQVEPLPEWSRARAVDSVIDLIEFGHGPRLGHSTGADDELRPAGIREAANHQCPKARQGNGIARLVLGQRDYSVRGPEVPGHR